MPLLRPRMEEKKEDFLARFMNNKSMIREFEDTKQRYIVALAQWKKRLEKPFKRNV